MKIKSSLGGLVALSAMSAMSSVARASDDAAGGALDPAAVALAALESQQPAVVAATGENSSVIDAPKAKPGRNKKADQAEAPEVHVSFGEGEFSGLKDPFDYSPSDYDIRREALHQSVTLVQHKTNGGGVTDVIITANEFYGFLKGPAA